eukprot:4893797-Heterocapsa_arctica.AAC.1
MVWRLLVCVSSEAPFYSSASAIARSASPAPHDAEYVRASLQAARGAILRAGSSWARHRTSSEAANILLITIIANCKDVSLRVLGISNVNSQTSHQPLDLGLGIRLAAPVPVLCSVCVVRFAAYAYLPRPASCT